MTNQPDTTHLITLFKDAHSRSLDNICTHPLQAEDIDLFIVDGKFNTRNHKVIDWLCTKIENGQTNLILDIQEFEED